MGIFRRPLPTPKLYPPPAKLVQMGQRRRAAAAYPRKSGRRSVVAAGLGHPYPKIAQRPAGAQRAFPHAFLAVYVQTLRRPRFCRVFGAIRHAHPHRQIRRGCKQGGKKHPASSGGGNRSQRGRHHARRYGNRAAQRCKRYDGNQ